MKYDGMAIPDFLRRDASPEPACITPGSSWHMPPHAPCLSAARRDWIAAAVTAAVEGGADTFGKIRKRLGDRYSDSEIRAGIRAARHWMPRLKPGRIRGRPVMRRTQVVLVLEGRRYRVIERR